MSAMLIVSCASCGTLLTRKRSVVKRSKSGLSFCNRSCKSKAQCIGGLTAIMPKHYSQVSGGKPRIKTTYRSIAFAAFSHECFDCKFNTHEKVLQVHHIDKDRSNNDLTNLVILCPTCHAVRHLLDKSGLFGSHRKK